MRQHELAEIFVISQYTLANYERMKRIPTIENLVKLADFFNVTLDQLIIQDLSQGGA